MKIDILTIFPEMVRPPLTQSLVGKALEKGTIQIRIHDIRDFAKDKHAIVDDVPFGGGAGMVMKVEPLASALEYVLDSLGPAKIILTTPQGKRFDQDKAKQLSLEEHIVIICGHYTGVDERLKQIFSLEEVSIGDYVLTGGELASLVIVDATVRLVPGVIGNFQSALNDSFFEGRLGYPQYTRPSEFKGIRVPEVLLSGDHESIRLWRKEQGLRKTLRNRPDLLDNQLLTQEDSNLLDKIKSDKV